MRPIDADSLKYRRKDYSGYDDVTDEERKRGILFLLEKDIIAAPTIDTVKHGKWIRDEGGGYSLYKCTACNGLCTVAGSPDCIPEEQMYKAFKYCPNCGAKMERSEERATSIP